MQQSPLTLNDNVMLVESFSVEEICDSYKKMGINVSSYFKDLNAIDLFECIDTGYRFYSPFTTIGDATFYEELSKKRENYYSNRWEHNVTLNQLDSTDNVLEVGSGFGTFLNLLKSINIKAKGLELNPHAVKKCIESGLDVQEKLIQEEAKVNTEKYSVVCYFQVLEHITEVNDFLKSSIDALKPNGKLIIGVPNNNPYLFISDKYHTLNLPPHHAGLWNKKSLKALESIFSLKLITMEFESLEYTYEYFLSVQIESSNILNRIILKTFKKIMPKMLKKVICKFINGRNVLAVYKKVD
ncbi:class I SAM-dependent methyltransferase [Olleya sp. AH-315-F22]|nr:class I SAM-dependent methyltransferase [Olleya sp. AH-315-F22]